MASEVSQSQAESLNVTIFKNGDIHYGGKRVLLNKKHTRDLDTFCDDLTKKIKPAGGAVRRLATPNHGHRIEDISQLEPGGMYVAMCDNRFKKLPYAEGPAKKTVSTPKEIRPVEHSSQYRAKSSQYRKQQVTGVTFRVYPNGDEYHPGACINLKPAQMKYGWGVILDLISESLQLCVLGLCTTAGEPVTDINSLHKDAHYVALGPQKRFIPMQYGQSTLSRNSSSKREPLPPIKKGQGRENNSEESNEEPKEEEEGGRHSRCTPIPRMCLYLRKDGRFRRPPTQEKNRSPVQKKPVDRNKYGRTQKKETPRQRQQQDKQQEEEDVFHAKPVKHKPNSRGKKPQKNKEEENGVFRAKDQNEETRGAEEVREDDQTETNYPIDQVEAEEVQSRILPPIQQARYSPVSPRPQTQASTQYDDEVYPEDTDAGSMSPSPTTKKKKRKFGFLSS